MLSRWIGFLLLCEEQSVVYMHIFYPIHLITNVCLSWLLWIGLKCEQSWNISLRSTFLFFPHPEVGCLDLIILFDTVRKLNTILQNGNASEWSHLHFSLQLYQHVVFCLLFFWQCHLDRFKVIFHLAFNSPVFIPSMSRKLGRHEEGNVHSLLVFSITQGETAFVGLALPSRKVVLFPSHWLCWNEMWSLHPRQRYYPVYQKEILFL